MNWATRNASSSCNTGPGVQALAIDLEEHRVDLIFENRSILRPLWLACDFNRARVFAQCFPMVLSGRLLVVPSTQS